MNAIGVTGSAGAGSGRRAAIIGEVKSSPPSRSHDAGREFSVYSSSFLGRRPSTIDMIVKISVTPMITPAVMMTGPWCTIANLSLSEV